MHDVNFRINLDLALCSDSNSNVHYYKHFFLYFTVTNT